MLTIFENNFSEFLSYKLFMWIPYSLFQPLWKIISSFRICSMWEKSTNNSLHSTWTWLQCEEQLITHLQVQYFQAKQSKGHVSITHCLSVEICYFTMITTSIWIHSFQLYQSKANLLFLTLSYLLAISNNLIGSCIVSIVINPSI